ncbi:hypothetical protein BGW38_003580, partial [Lunasporangiospora selenospora]
LLSKFDFVQYVPGAIIGEQQDRDPDVSSLISVTPSSILPWEGFLAGVRNMELERTPHQYQPPRFKDDRTFRPELMLHELFSQDVGSVRALPPYANTTRIMRLARSIPDLVCLRSGGDPDASTSVLFPIEIKRPALLRSRDLLADFLAQQQTGVAQGPMHAVTQLYGYMLLNGYRFGVLSTFEQTWFFIREGEGGNNLVASPAIAFDRTEPSLLQCYLWFIRLANADERIPNPLSDSEVELILGDEGQPEDDKQEQDDSDYKPKTSRLKKAISTLISPRKTRSSSRTTARVLVPGFSDMQLISHDEGAQTYRATWKGYDVVVKKCDIWNQHLVMEELKHEARVYQQLRSIQGRYIPRLRMAGVADGMEMVLVTDHVGTDVSQERLDARDQEKIRAALCAIHDQGVVHGDIQPHNILVKRNNGLDDRFYFVDFGLSRTHTAKAQYRQENAVLESLLRGMNA